MQEQFRGGRHGYEMRKLGKVECKRQRTCGLDLKLCKLEIPPI